MKITNNKKSIIGTVSIVLVCILFLFSIDRPRDWEPITEWGHWRLGHRSNFDFLEQNKFTLTFGSGAPNFEDVTREEFERRSNEAREFNRMYNERGYIVLRYMTSGMRGETVTSEDQPSREDIVLVDFYKNNWHEYEDYIGSKPPESHSPDTWLTVHPDNTFPYYRYAPYGMPKTGRFETWGCPNNPYYSRLMEGRIRSQAEVGINGVYIDWTHIPGNTCYCSYCVEHFKEYLNDNLPIDVAQKKYDVSDYSGVLLPQGHTDPFWLEWVKFRGHSLAEFHKNLRNVAREYNPFFLVSGNVFGGFGYGPFAYDAAANMEILGRDGYHDFLYSEIQEFLDFAPHKNKDGIKITNSPALKFLTAASQGKPVIVYATEITAPIYPDPTPQVLGAMAQINIAESVANQAIFREKRETPQEATDIYNFLYQNEESLVGAHKVSNIAVLTSLNQFLAREQSFSFSFSRVLADKGIAHVLAVEDDITSGKIKQFDLLVIPFIPLLTNEKQEVLVQYVRDGGSLLILGNSGHKNEYNLPQETIVLQSLFPDNLYPEDDYFSKKGNGRIGFIPLVIPPSKFLIPPRVAEDVTTFGPSMADVFADTPEGYTRGRIDAELKRILSNVADKALTILNSNVTRIQNNTPFVEISTMLNSKNNRLLVHLVNYNVTIFGEITPASNTIIRLELPDGKNPGKLVYSGTLGDMVPVKYNIINNGPRRAIEFVADTVDIYGLAVLELN
jgi:hypothetical protein